MTVFNGKALFTGANTAGHLGLWVTDGTVAGTQELTSIVGASTTGLDPSDMTVFSNEVLFNGVDANGLSGLWVTDGTVGGTHELLAGGGASDPAGLNPTNITVYNNEVLFSGLDASGDMGLWVSDGTAAGTHELTGIAGADSSGLGPSDLTVLQRRGPVPRPRRIGRPAAVGHERDRSRHARGDGHRRSGDEWSRAEPVRVHRLRRHGAVQRRRFKRPPSIVEDERHGRRDNGDKPQFRDPVVRTVSDRFDRTQPS